MEDQVNSLISNLFKVNAIKFGSYKLKSGLNSPIYFDLRLMISYPQILNTIADLIWKESGKKSLEFDVICGVPYTALPIATIVSVQHNIPMILKRKEQKTHGTGKILEGEYEQGARCLVIEDVATTGSSVVETAEILRQHGIIVTDVILILDRDQGARANLEAQGITMHTIITIKQMLQTLLAQKHLSQEKVDEVLQYFADSKKLNETASENVVIAKTPKLSFEDIVQLTILPKILSKISRQLVEIMLKKKTNLCLSADLDDWKTVLKITEVVGRKICLLKTHVDAMNFESFAEILTFRNKLAELSDRYEFLIMEDRKFGDIGSTVQKQLKGKPFEIQKWAHLVTAHGIPGPGILQSLEQDVGVVLIAEMSSKGNLATALPGYKSEILKMTEKYESTVAGFVSQSKVTGEGYPNYFLQFTPGVSIEGGTGDGLGQQYCSVENAILKRGADIIIVGRAILNNPKDKWITVAEEFRDQGWEAWTKKLCSESESSQRYQ